MNASARLCIYQGDRDLTHRRVGVLGLARSGVACIRFLAERGASVTALDLKPLAQLSPQAQSAAALAQRVLAPYSTLAEALPLDTLVVSPGVPTESPLVLQARTAGVAVIGEVELAYRFCDAPIAAVTGTCGKGTTVTALGALLAAAGKPHVVAGNIGLPLIGEVARSAALDVVVAEISSFQLETTAHFHPHIAAVLNVTEDHLERYPSFAAYALAKQLIFRNQVATDWALYCTDDPQARSIVGQTAAQSLTVSLREPRANARLEGERLVLQLPGRPPEVIASRADLPLQGDHHVTNFLTAALAARLCEVPAAVMAEGLRAYRPAAHLMTLVAERGGVRYLDDSKATNPASAIADLSSIAGPVVVIAGGKEKDTDFAEFGRLLASRARCVILLGECAARIAAAVGRPELCRDAASMEEAVSLAVAAAQPGDTVALCPACSSLDMFASYARRGDLFAEAVRRHLP